MLNRAPGTPELSACRSPFLGSHFQKRRGREEKDPWGFCCDALPHHTEYDTGYMQPVMTKVNRLNKMGRDGGRDRMKILPALLCFFGCYIQIALKHYRAGRLMR